jgi:hypothetical protein
MIDLKALQNEVCQARQARLDAEAASADVENMLRLVLDPEAGRGRFCFFIDGLETDIAAAA